MVGIIDRIKAVPAETKDAIVAKSRERWISRWMARTEELTGLPCTSEDDIAWAD